MFDSLGTWLTSIAATALIAAIARALSEKTPAIRPVSYICGLLMILVILGPIAEISFESLSSYVAAYKIEADDITGGVEIDNKEILASIIREDTQAYILDKAKTLGFDCSVEVETEMGENGYPYPSRVTITAEPTAEQKEALSKLIESDLAIPSDRQEWKLM